MIPQTSPVAAYEEQKGQIDAAIARVLDSGWYILGREVAEFEQEFAEYVGSRDAIGVASGTDAIEVALRACGVGQGDAVFTVSHTAVGTVVGIERSGATVVLVDVDADTYTMSPERLEGAIRSAQHAGVERLAAVVPVHLYGQPADMPAILAVAKEHGMRVVEDCAQAHGAALETKKVGTWGDAAAFSFYPTKNLGAFGDGGIVVASDPGVVARAREIREYGWRERFVSSECGLNSRLDELQAAILRTRLTTLDADNQRRRRIAGAYDQALAGAPLQLPIVRPGAEHVYHQYVVRCDERDGLRAFLKSRNIQTAVHYPASIDQQPAYAGRLTCCDQLPATTKIIPRIISLPMFPQLSLNYVEMVAKAILDWTRR